MQKLTLLDVAQTFYDFKKNSVCLVGTSTTVSVNRKWTVYIYICMHFYELVVL